MSASAAEWDRQHLPALLELTALGGDRFAGQSNEPNAYANLFGGQLMAQGLAAADATAPGRTAHSFTAHFLRAGSPRTPVEYQVERLRDGARLSVRRVSGYQGDTQLFTTTHSYRTELSGFEHQFTPALEPALSRAINIADLARSGRKDLLPYFARFVDRQPFDICIPEERGFLSPGDALQRRFWMRAPSLSASDDPAVHRQALTYLTDILLPGASLASHTIPLPGPHLVAVTLSHSLWFHRPVRCDDWLMFDTDSPSASSGVALARGLIYDSKGALVATASQEALQRGA